MIETLKRLIAIPSVTGSPDVKDALHLMLDVCKDFGFRTKNLDDRMGWAEIGEGDPLIGILCHLDVVPAAGEWTHDPFRAEIVDGRIYGRGTADDKGPAIAAVWAMKELLEEKAELRGRVRILFGCEEEGGDWTDMEYYKAHEELPAFGFTPDADFPAIYGEKRILHVSLSMPLERSGFRAAEGGDAPNMVPDHAKAVLADGTVLETTGVAAHGSLPAEGENAITKLMELAAAHGKETGAGCPFADFYMDTIGWDLDGSRIGCGFSDEPSGALTFSVGTIAVAEEDVPRIAVTVDMRAPVTVTEEAILASLEKAAAPYGVSVTKNSGERPVYMDQNGAVITKLMEAYRELTGDYESQPKLIGGGTYARAMDGIVAFGPLFPGREATEHRRDEYAYIDDLWKAKDIYKLAIRKLAE